MKAIPLRSLPRLFVPGATPGSEFELPRAEVDKLRKVLRLTAGALIAVLPNDGSLIRCEFHGHMARPIETLRPETEPNLHLTVAQALPKADKLDEIVRSCTEIGVSRFILFPGARSVVRWDAEKLGERLQRLETIAREAAEVSFRTRLPVFEVAAGLSDVLAREPGATVLSEAEGETRPLVRSSDSMVIVIGPEGGWDQKELALVGSRGATLGPRVLRVDHAAAAAAAILLLSC